MILDLTMARALFAEALMPDTCTISTATGTSDGGGAATPGAPTTVSSRCRFWTRTRTGRRDQEGDLVQQHGSYGLALPVDVVVAPTAAIIVAGRSFQIVYQPPVVGLSFEQELGLEEVR